MRHFVRHLVRHPMRHRLPRLALLVLLGLAWHGRTAAIAADAPRQPADGAGRYRLDETFPRMPPGVTFGAGSGVATDSRGDVYVFHRAEPPVLVFHPNGEF